MSPTKTIRLVGMQVKKAICCGFKSWHSSTRTISYSSDFQPLSIGYWSISSPLITLVLALPVSNISLDSEIRLGEILKRLHVSFQDTSETLPFIFICLLTNVAELKLAPGKSKYLLKLTVACG